MPPSDAVKRRKFEHWVKWFVGISATVSALILLARGEIGTPQLLLFAVFIYILTTFEHPLDSNVKR